MNITPEFTIEEIAGADELAPVWVELEARADAPFYLSWDWIGCWLREAKLRPTVLAGRIAGRIVLLAVVTPASRRDVLPIAFHGLHLNMSGVPAQDIITTEYNGFLIDRDWAGRIESKAIAFLLRGLVVAGQRRDELHLKNVADGFQRWLPESGLTVRELQRKPSWRVDLSAIRAGEKSYLNGLSSNTRQQIRRSMRLYEQHGKLSASPAATVPEALEYLDGLAELHQRYWNSRGEPGGFSFQFFAEFQRSLIQTCLPRGTVEIIKVAAGDHIIGYVYNMVYRGEVSAYQTGFNYESDARLKPGLVSHTLCIEQHIRDGSAVYDFLAGEHRYKANLGDPGPDLIYLLAERPTLALMAETRLHDARRKLGAVWRQLRQTHRVGASPRAHRASNVDP